MKNNLKPCPFCGSQAVRAIKTTGKNSFTVTAACTGNTCGATIEFTYHAPVWVKEPERAAKMAITKAWNKRDWLKGALSCSEENM